MTELTPNTPPKGQSCGTCRFATTHTFAEDHRTKVTVKCCRFPPVRLGRKMPREEEHVTQLQDDTAWPYTLWDDWCGEWKARLK